MRRYPPDDFLRFVVFQKGAAGIRPNGIEPNNGNPGYISDVGSAIGVEEGNGMHIQLLGHLVDIPWREDNILTVCAALATLGTVKLECVIKTNGHILNVCQ